MNWFYVDTGQQAGPVTDEQLDDLVRSGKVRGDTLVWREGLANWQPYSQARPEGVQPPAPVPPAAQPMAAAAPTAGGVVPPPGAYQPMPGAVYGLAYAGFWMRFLAKLIDGLIIGAVVGIPIAFFMFRGALSGAPPDLQRWVQFFTAAPWQLLETAIGLLYNGFFLGKFGATPGKMALGLKVLSPEGNPISYGRAFGRSAAEIISRIICFIGYIIAGFDVQKRALHDHIASTRVIKSRL
jgi:uncharacterized RDD family membrane protein YckC